MRHPVTDAIHITPEARGEVCRYCRMWRSQHVESKCLFETTSFAPMSEEEFHQFTTDLLKPLVDWFDMPIRYVGVT